MSKFIPSLLKRSIEYFAQQKQSQPDDRFVSNQILYFIQIMYKNIEFAIGTDDDYLDNIIDEADTKLLLDTLSATSFSALP